ncbi:MAG: FtsQ-type POTRA domain-containing protein [Solobacterium sp.]|nr:FtsQ-type POTRA domain-containing protein [Solobacterium sp.]
MGLDKTKTLEDFRNIPNGVEQLFREREIKNDNEGFEAARGKLFAGALFLSIFLIVMIYYFSPASKVRAISVSGNKYLETKYIESLAGISSDSRYYLTFPFTVEKRIKADPMIDSVNIKMMDSNAIHITVSEKRPLGYRYSGDVAYILFDDETQTELTSEYMPVVSRIPYITGFDEEEQTHLLVNALKAIDQMIIEDVAEIHQYALKYDDEAIQFQMRDGTYVFSGYFYTKPLNEYYRMISQVENKDYCLYTVESGKAEERMMVSARACPWDEVPIEHEYWMDANGDYILNKYGDRVVKHYYQDANGFYFLDENGNYILIPINEKGEDQRDPDFDANYHAGYYKTGELVIPTEEPEEPAEEGGEETGEDAEEAGDAKEGTETEENGESGDEQG